MWELRYHPSIRKDTRKIPFIEREKIRLALEELAQDPFSDRQVRFLVKHPIADYRLRVGDYRVFFDIHTALHEIWILMIKRRTTDTY